MLSIIWSIICIVVLVSVEVNFFAAFFFNFPDIFAAFFFNIPDVFTVFAVELALYTFPLFVIFCLVFAFAALENACKQWKMKKYNVKDVAVLVTKREHKKGSYKVIVTYEDLTVTLDNKILYNVCREGETIHAKLYTHTHKGSCIRTLSID